ncbi:MAG TPA: hypothetical protein VHD85_11465 [Terracidiphilus sp.]|nr:hypothetical protein [Terracidiphilus sp.]
MSDTGDDVNHIRMLFKNRGKGGNYIFDSFVGRQKAKRQENGFSLGRELILEVVGVHEWHVGYAMRDYVDLRARNSVLADQKTACQIAHDDQAIGQSSNLLKHCALIHIRITQHCM